MTHLSGLQSRISGALLGLAIGDALGAPVEHLSSQIIARDYPYGFGQYVERASVGLRPGQGTDDTEMAFLVAVSLVEWQTLNMDDIAQRLVDWGQGHPALGPSTGAGIAALARGVHWSEAGQSTTASSGCLPRCAPVAFCSSAEQLVANTLTCCRATHQHPLALAATVTQNILLEHLIRGQSWSSATALLRDKALAHSAYLEPIATALADGPAMPGAVAVLVEALRCVDTAETASQALEVSLKLGGDTDTRGAVAGALAGARWGVESFPQAWVDGCEAGAEACALGLALCGLRLEEEI